MIFAASKLDLTKQLDNDMFNHVTYVANRILMLAKKEGTSKESLVIMGKYLWRLFRVFQAYSAKQEKITLEKVINVVIEFKEVFGGT